MRLIRPVAILALASFQMPAFAAPGQSPANQAPAVQAGQVAQATLPATQPDVLQANANLVLVDVVVTNRGKAVENLDRSHFHLFEDGHEQAITSFDEHKLTPVGTPAAKPPALPPNFYTNIPSYPAATAVNVLLLDGLNTPMVDQMRVRQQMLQYMGKIAPGTTMAVFTLSSRLRMIEGFTTNPALLTKAVLNRKAAAQPSVVLDPGADQSLDSMVGQMAEAGASADAIAGLQQFQADLTAYQTDQRVQMTLDALNELARYLSAIPGRKNLIWFSGSFPISLDPDASLSNPFQAMRNYSDQVRETDELLSASRVAVYPVDARGLMGLPTSSATYTPSTNLVPSAGSKKGSGNSTMVNVPNPSKDNAKFQAQSMNEMASMKQIAEETGGKEFLNTNGLKEAVASAVENGGSYYTIGFVPPAKQVDTAMFHKIQVHADNGGWELAYRRGFYADFSEKPSAHNPGKANLATAAVLHGAPPATQIVFDARVLAATDPLLKDIKVADGPAGEMSASLKGQPHRYVVDLIVDAHTLAFDLSPEGVHLSQVEFVLVAYDGESQRVNYVDRGLLLKLKPEQYASAMATGIHLRFAIDFPAGQNSLRIAVHDLAAERVGSLEVPITVAKL